MRVGRTYVDRTSPAADSCLEGRKLRFSNRSNHVHEDGAKDPLEARGKGKGPLAFRRSEGMCRVLRNPNEEIQGRAENQIELSSRRMSSVKGLADQVGDKDAAKMEELVRETVKARGRIARPQKNRNNTVEGREQGGREVEGVTRSVVLKNKISRKRKKSAEAPHGMAVGVE